MFRFKAGKHSLRIIIDPNAAGFNPTVTIFDFSGSMNGFFEDLKKAVEASIASGATTIIFSTTAHVHSILDEGTMDFEAAEAKGAYFRGTVFTAALEAMKPYLTPDTKVYMFTDGEVYDREEPDTKEMMPAIHATLAKGTGLFQTFYAGSGVPAQYKLLDSMCFNAKRGQFPVDKTSEFMRELLGNTIRDVELGKGKVQCGAVEVTLVEDERLLEGCVPLDAMKERPLSEVLSVATAILAFYKHNADKLNALSLRMKL